MPNPFLNRAVIQRTAALSRDFAEGGYARDFSYREVCEVPTVPGAKKLTGLLAAGVTSAMRRIAAMSSGRLTHADRVLRRLLTIGLEGAVTAPSEAGSDGVSYSISLRGRSDSKQAFDAVLEVDGDPGYRSTGRIIAEAALALLARPSGAPGGVLTPATAFGTRFFERLPHAGMRLSVVPASAAATP